MPICPKKLTLPKSGKISHIIHLSDLHIRTGDIEHSRFKEYENVFNQFIQDIKLLPHISNNSTILLLAGDIFEHKNRIESPGIRLFYSFLGKLSNIAPVYIIQGNHDFRQDQPDSPDLLSSLLLNNENENICYMDQTGIYLAGDIGFGLVSVKDTLKKGDTSGQVEDLPPFPPREQIPKTN